MHREAVKEFWENNKSGFSGDICAPEIIRLSKRYIKGKVLDIGAGSGSLINLLPAIGIDIAPRRPEILPGSIDDLPFNSNAFYTVFATDLLEHLDNDTLHLGLQEVHRVLVPGGYFIFTVPNLEDMNQNIVHCPYCHQSYHRWGHQQIFNLSIISNLLQNNFKIIQLKALPLALMAQNWIVRYGWPFLVWRRYIQANELFVVVQKVEQCNH